MVCCMCAGYLYSVLYVCGYRWMMCVVCWLLCSCEYVWHLRLSYKLAVRSCNTWLQHIVCQSRYLHVYMHESSYIRMSQWVTSHMDESRFTWMSHVTQVFLWCILCIPNVFVCFPTCSMANTVHTFRPCALSVASRVIWVLWLTDTQINTHIHMYLCTYLHVHIHIHILSYTGGLPARSHIRTHEYRNCIGAAASRRFSLSSATSIRDLLSANML